MDPEQAFAKKTVPSGTRAPSSLCSAALALLAACGGGSSGADMAAPDLAPRRVVTVFPGRFGRDVDVLLVIDNSPAMSPKQAALAQALPGFVNQLDDSGANYQIGVVTTDVGSWAARGQPWALSLGACDSFAGDDGLLQRGACSARSGQSQAAQAACQALCPDPRFVPAGNSGAIRKINGVTNVPTLIDPQSGKDLGPQRALQCLALVGDSGCALEAPLESARRALDGHLAGNAGLLRPGSLLSVLWLTDEDDCSVSPAGRVENNPLTRDCAAPDSEAAYDCFNPDYRCLARSTICDQPLNSPGPKSGCRERPSSYLEPVATYTDFFSLLRPPSKLLLSGIYTLPALPTSQLRTSYQNNASSRSDNLNRASGADAACVNAAAPTIFGQAQHRLSKFMGAFRDAREFNVCDTGGYDQALREVAAAIKTRVRLQCLPFRPVAVADSDPPRPDCVVGDVPAQTPDAPPAQTFPLCSTACCGALASQALPAVDSPAVRAACAAEPSPACFCASTATGAAVTNNVCPAGVIAAVIRKAGPDTAPPGTVTSFNCRAR